MGRLQRSDCWNSFCILRDYEATNGCGSSTIDVKKCPQRLLFLRIKNRMKKIKTGNAGKDLWITELRRFRKEFQYRVRERT